MPSRSFFIIIIYYDEDNKDQMPWPRFYFDFIFVSYLKRSCSEFQFLPHTTIFSVYGMIFLYWIFWAPFEFLIFDLLAEWTTENRVVQWKVLSFPQAWTGVVTLPALVPLCYWDIFCVFEHICYQLCVKRGREKTNIRRKTIAAASRYNYQNFLFSTAYWNLDSLQLDYLWGFAVYGGLCPKVLPLE